MKLRQSCSTGSEWRRRAACRGQGPANWYPPKHYADALPICEGCPVRAECLAEALSLETEDYARHGLWGGKTPNERREASKAAKRRRNRPDAA